MNRFRQRKSWIVLIAVLLLFAACKGETPTAPPPGSGTPPGGGSTPPTGVDIALTSTNSSPLVDSIVTITATVTDNGQPVPNGTAVEFNSSGGSLNSSGRSVIRTTTNGVATVSLTSSTSGTVRVTATVNNVTRNIDVAFQTRPIDPVPPNTAPSISSVVPAVGRPAGGQIIRINGANFRVPVRVLFDVGQALPVEASVVAVTDTTIDVVTPAVNLGAGQQLPSDIIVITQAGSTTEQRVEQTGAFTFRNESLTPVISTVTPNSGPVTGGTRVTIIGEGFQEPVQVLFGTAEARVLNVTFNQILAESPAARDTTETGSGTVTGAVDVTVRNINSNTVVTKSGGFLYKAAMQITSAGPGSGPATGGTRITIDGIGFIAPVSVVVRAGGADIALQVISVTGTRIVAITPELALTSCGDVTGPIVVTNIVNGDQVDGPSYRFAVPKPTIVNVNPSVATQGTTPAVFVTVANALGGVNRFKLGDKTVFPSGAVVNVDGTVTFTLPLPTNFTFDTQACTVGGVEGEQFVPLELDVTYTNVGSTCTDTADAALTVNPADTTCRTPPPPPIATVTSPASGCATFSPDPIVATGTAQGTTTITFTNAVAAGGGSLTISGATVTGTNGTFTINQTGAGPIAPGGNASFTITVDPTSGPSPITGTATFSTNDPNRPTVSVCLTGNASP